MSLVLQLKKLIEAGASDTILKRFRALTLPTPCSFEAMKEDDIQWRAEVLREKSAKDHVNLSLSPLQRGFCIWSWPAKTEKKIGAPMTIKVMVSTYGGRAATTQCAGQVVK